MIEGLPLEYAQARMSARLGGRPDERLWHQARSARSVAALLDMARSSRAASYVTGIEAGADGDEIELAMRQQLRSRIAEAAGWAPLAWRASLVWTQHLIDLPAIGRLLETQPLPAWMGVDPALAPFALPTRSLRREALHASALAPLARALEADSSATSRVGPAHKPALPRVVKVWGDEWRRRWPRCRAQVRADLERLQRLVVQHLTRFASARSDDTPALRSAFDERVARLARHAAGQPVALFAYLILVALDLERLRGEFAPRAAFANRMPS